MSVVRTSVRCMGCVGVADRQAIMAAYDEFEAAFEKVAALPLDALTHPDLLALMSRREVLSRRQAALEHAVINRLAAETCPGALGATSWAEVLATRLQISKGAARRRIKYAELFGARTALTGEPLAPRLAHVAAAQARGQIGSEHLRVIAKFFKDLPAHLRRAHPRPSRGRSGRHRARIGAGAVAPGRRPAGPAAQPGRRCAQRRRTGPAALPGAQGADGMSHITGLLDPTLDAVLAKWAAPGMCDPDDPSPTVDGDPDAHAKRADLRSQPQRNHDALTALGRAMLASGQLGQHNGLPATIIVSTTLQELASGHGQAVTGGRHPAADDRCDPARQPRASLPGDLRPPHPTAAVSRAQQAHRLSGTADRVVRLPLAVRASSVTWSRSSTVLRKLPPAICARANVQAFMCSCA